MRHPSENLSDLAILKAALLQDELRAARWSESTTVFDQMGGEVERTPHRLPCTHVRSPGSFENPSARTPDRPLDSRVPNLPCEHTSLDCRPAAPKYQTLLLCRRSCRVDWSHPLSALGGQILACVRCSPSGTCEMGRRRSAGIERTIPCQSGPPTPAGLAQNRQLS